MAFGEDDLGAFGSLTRAIGLTRGVDGANNPDWFGDPVGGTGSGHTNDNGFGTILSDDDQRTALTDFVDSVLGAPAGHDDDGARWVPLFANADPAVTVYAVLEPTGSATAGTVRVGVGVEHSTGSGAQHEDAPRVTTRLHVPIAHVARGTDARPDDGPNPSWLLLGREGGRIGVEVEATFTDAAPVAGEAFLRGMSVSVGIPTGPEPVAFSLSLLDLQLPGATSPTTRTLTLDNLATAGNDLIEFLIGLVRAQVAALPTTGAATAKVRALAGMLGLRDGVTDLPALPLHDIIDRGLPAFVEWIEDILGAEASLDAWLAEVAALTGGTADADRNAVAVTLGPCIVLVGLAVTEGTGGHPTLTPWIELAYGTRSGAQVRACVELLRADTGTGAATAIPNLRAEAVFGQDAGGTRLFAGPVTDLRLGSVHLGIRLDEARRPAFVLTLHEVGVPNQPTRAILDLSSPDAALDAADDVLDGVLSDALDSLGDAGELLKILLGVNPPGTVVSPGIIDIVRDPIATMRDYWLAVTGNQDAMIEALAAVRQLLLGVTGGVGPAIPAVPGTGTEADPWRIALGSDDTVGLDFWRVGTTLRLAISAGAALDVLEGVADLRVDASARLSLVTVDLSTGAASFLEQVVGRAGIGPRDVGPAVFELGGGLAIEAPRIGVDVTWSPRSGVRVTPSGDGIALRVPAVVAGPGPGGGTGGGTSTADRLPIPLPPLDDRGAWDLDAWAPDWSGLERVLGHLLRRGGSDVLDALADLVGWGGENATFGGVPVARARLALDVLLTNPAAALEQWLLDLALDCHTLESALRPAAWLLSAGSLSAPLGDGRPERPWRIPIGGVASAPGMAVWTVPGCPASSPRRGVTEVLDLLTGASVPRATTTASVLAAAAPAIPDLADLLHGRTGLGAGLSGLVTRWYGTDGLIGAPATVEDSGRQVLSGDSGVSVTVSHGMTYAALVASARLGSGLPVTPGAGGVSAAVVHVGCDEADHPGWLEQVPAGQRIDATGSSPAAVPATGDGPWFVLVPSVAAAAADRPDHDGLLAQAERVATALAGRTAPVVLVGHGGAGAATVRATSLGTVAAQVDDVVTIGTPWGPVATTAFETDLAGDALRLLTALAPSTITAAPDNVLALGSSPERQARDLLWRSRTEPSLLPSALAVPRDPSVRVHASFASLETIDIDRALAAFVAQAVGLRVSALEALPSGAPQEVHLGIDLPVVDGTVGELLLGASARLDLLAVDRVEPHVRPLREVAVTFRVAVANGWLVGGPGATQHDLECRWAAVTVHVPLDGGAGRAEVTLHEARAHTAYREVWVVTGDATGAPPEVRILLGEVVARMSANGDLAALLTAIGLLRDGGLDPGGLDHLLHDPAATLRTAVSAAPQVVAQAVRALVGGSVPSDLAPTAFRIAGGPARLTVDLATATLEASFSLTEPIPLTLTLTAGPSGAGLDLAVGLIDGAVGGVRVVGHAGAGGATLRLEHAAPGRPVVPLALLPDGNAQDLLPLVTTLLPALVLQALGTALRELVEDPVLDECLSAAGLLGSADPESEVRAFVLPFGLIQDPAGWLRARVDPLTATVTLLDALARVITPARGTTPGWPLTDEVTVTYAVVSGRLEVGAHVDLSPTIDGRPVTTALAGGLSIGTTGAPVALLDARVTVDGWGLDLGVGGTDPAPVRLDLVRPVPGSAIRLVPAGAGLGSALASGAESLVVLALNELISHRADASSLRQQLAQATFDLCGALDLLVASRVDSVRLRAYTAPPGPGAALLARLPALATTGLAALAGALDPVRTVVASTLTGTVRRFDLGTLVGGTRPFFVVVDGSGTPSVSFGCDVALGDWGRVAVEELRIDATGVRVSVRGGPFVVALGPTTLRPLVVIRAGVAGGEFSRLVAIGLSVDDVESVQLRWGLDDTPPELWAITAGPSPGQSQTPEAIAADLLGIGVEIVSGLVAQQLSSVISTRATALLRDVVFSNAQRRIDPGFVHALFHPEELLDRLNTLAWNCATASPGLSLTIDDQVTIGLVSDPSGPGDTKAIGLRLDVAQPLVLADGDPKVELVSRSDWITGAPPQGLSIFLLEGTRTSLEFVPAVRVAGVGLRFSGAQHPIVDLDGFSIDAIEVNLYGEATRAGLGGGIRLKLDGLSVAPSGGGGENGMANSLMSDVGSASGSSRPSFSPSLALQRHPGPTETLGVTVRAGDPPGPWWLVVQRQLGPLYVERVGLGTTESNGEVTSISLLFSGQISLFGLTGAVDGLGITWKGGDLADLRNWAVDLNGIAVAAEMAGVSLSGGLLKFTEAGSVSYVGMLVGRFAAYGLSVFGGFTNDHGNASFFIFGGVNGPFGGPPMFFLTGIGGGLGINRGLKVPSDLSKFGEFPFIQALDPAASPPDDPMVRLRELSEYFPHRMGEFWFAAGISFTSFNLVDGVAVLSVSFGNGLEINLFGLARMALPRPDAAIVSIELALLAHFSTSEGVFLIKAQLTDNSWLLYEDVRLTGGFAFAIWWKGPLAGQFVLTMGGYHPDFPLPVGYPEVPRLGLVWKVSDAIVIKGGSYFALTSEALMAGLDIEVSLDFGWVWAKVAFGAHGIVFFDPFWFQVEAYARISAGIDIDLPWPFGSLSFSISIGASITVWGPEFAGRAEFEIGPCSVPVEFGDTRRVEPETLDWPAFVTKYLEDAGTSAKALSAITGRGTLPTATTSPKGAPTSDGTSALPFQVFAEFELTFTTTIPASGVEVGLPAAILVPLTLSNGAATGLGLAPMGASELSSTLRVTLEHLDFRGEWQDDAAHLAALAANVRVERDHYPLGVWGSPKSLGAAPALPSTDVITAGNRLTLVAGIDTDAVGPQIEYRRVVAGRRPLPLRATGATRTAFLRTSRDLALPVPETANDALALAKATLFPAVANVMTAGQHSALARASYRRDRVSPPRIGSLTDGLAKTNGTNGKRLPADTAPVTVRGVRRPVVAALLTSGVGAAVRASATTVSDGALKRRPAPTLESVKGRLGAHVPVVLNRTAAPGVVKGGTVLATTLPRTDAVGSIHSYAVGRVGASLSTGGGGALVGGLGGLAGTTRAAPRRSTRAARAEATGTRLRPGDLVVLRSPDAQIDVDTQSRPSLAVDGSARIVTVTGRIVSGDAVVSGASLDIPAGTTLVAAHAGGSATAVDGGGEGSGGSAGWTTRSRVARLGSHVGVSAGCTLSVDVAGGVFQDASATRWCDADELVASAREVITRFTGPVGVVAVALTGQAPSGPVPAGIDLVGASPKLAADGTPQPPIAVVLGSTTVLVHEVVTDDEQLPGGGVRVIVRSGGAWQVTAVLAAHDPEGGPTAYAERLAGDGVDALVGRLLATDGDGAELTWTDPPSPRPRRAR